MSQDNSSGLLFWIFMLIIWAVIIADSETKKQEPQPDSTPAAVQVEPASQPTTVKAEATDEEIKNLDY